MRIAIVTATFPPYYGGMGAAAAEQAAVFARLGHDVTVLAPGQGNADMNLPYRVRRLAPLFRVGNGAVLPQLIWQLRGYDAVVLHYPAFGLLKPVYLWRKIFGRRKKFAVMYHMDPIARGFRGFVFWLSEIGVAPLLLRSTDSIIVSTLDYAQHGSLARFGSRVLEKCVEIPFSVDTEYFSSGDAEEKRNFQMQFSEKNILFVGGMDTAHDFKGVPALLQAWSAAEISGATLHLVGDGNLRSSYEKMAASLGLGKQVHFHGAASKEMLRSLLRDVDLLVMSSLSRSEAFGIVLIEAMACGVPVVASDLPGVRTVVKNGETGWLVPPGDVSGLASAFKNAFADMTRLQEMGEHARERACAEYGKKIFEKRNAAFLDRLFSKHV